MSKFTFPAQYYRDAFPFASDDATRPRLTGVLYDAGGTIVATDGHTLLAAKPDAADRVAPPRDVIIPPSKALFGACKAEKRGWPKFVVIDQPDPTIRAITIDVVLAETAAEALEPAARPMFTLRTELLDEEFVHWRVVVPVMPEQALACAPTYSARYLTRFGGVARNDALRVVPTSDERGAAFVDLGRDDAFGVIMPKSYGISTSRLQVGLLSSPLPVVPAWARAV